MDLTFILATALAFGILLYTLLDGFDLGVGMLFPFAETDEHRAVMLNSLAPVWDGNETWLIFGGAVLFAAFPAAYSTLLPAFYLPIMLLLFSLIARGVALEFHQKASASRPAWSAVFFLGSLFATFAQGVLLGAFINGVAVEERRFVGDPLDWLTPFSMITGLALIAGYGLLGATWLVMKTRGELQAWARRWGRGLVLAALGALAFISLQTPLTHPDIAARWFGGLNMLWLAPLPLATATAGLLLWRKLGDPAAERSPFFLSTLLIALSYAGLGISLWPWAVPRGLTLWEAAAPDSSLAFILVWVALTMPVVLAFTGYAYYTFRGKVGSDIGYGD